MPNKNTELETRQRSADMDRIATLRSELKELYRKWGLPSPFLTRLTTQEWVLIEWAMQNDQVITEEAATKSFGTIEACVAASLQRLADLEFIEYYQGSWLVTAKGGKTGLDAAFEA